VKGEVILVMDQGPELSSFDGDESDGFRLFARVVHLTDVGRRRRNNQDNYLVLALDGRNIPQPPQPLIVGIEDTRLLLAVADGMGGHFGGEVASRLCVENLAKEIVGQLQTSANGNPDLPLTLQRAVEASHKALFAHAQGYAEKLTMGTTLTAALLHEARVEVAQVGDSRGYLYRDGNLILLTQDQTIGNQLRGRGEDSTKVDPQIREMLIQAVGAQAEIQVIMTAVDLEPEDFLLVCCDGLHKIVSPAEIVETLETDLGLHEKATHLVARANDCGGPDNITVILTEICQVESTS
jgi:PPM family protein phosphatase